MGEHVYVYVCIDVSVSLNRAMYVSNDIERDKNGIKKTLVLCEAI